MVDFDPHGISIFRTYQIGSRRLEHEDAATVPGLKWLGIRSEDVMPYTQSDPPPTPTCSQRNQSQPSLNSTAYSSNGTSDPNPPLIGHPWALTRQISATHIGLDHDDEHRPQKRVKVQNSQDSSGSIIPLASNDRKRAVSLMKEIASSLTDGTMADVDTARDQLAELQKMLMLNIKAEIQAVDSFGDVTSWLDWKLCSRIHG